MGEDGAKMEPRQGQESAKKGQEGQDGAKKARFRMALQWTDMGHRHSAPSLLAHYSCEWNDVILDMRSWEGHQLWVCSEVFCDPKRAPRQPKRAQERSGQPQGSPESPERPRRTPRSVQEAALRGS